MCTGRTEVRRRNECCEFFEIVSFTAVIVIIVVVAAFGAYLHTTVHGSNTCQMTYMYRRLEFQLQNIAMPYPPTKKYSLSVYNEGVRWRNHSGIEPGQIPVLFIPGSQGSAKQARSLASLMQNKTESRRAPFSFRFFAVDFDEEITFLNGNIGNRQLDYVMHAIRKIKSLMKHNRKQKIVLVGHSYGGMTALLTTIHKDHQNDVELVIVKGAPVNKQPILIDWLSMRLSMFLVNQWNAIQVKELKHVGVVAYTGGLRDYLIPDEWSVMKNITHRPLWAIEGVSDLGADHLAILWCNEFVRHVSRVLWAYGENVGKMTGREVVQKFYRDETERNIKRANLTKHVTSISSTTIRLGERHKGLLVNNTQHTLLIKPERFQVFQVRVNASCLNTMTTVRYDETMMHFKNATDGVVETWIYRAVTGERVRLLLDVTPPCSIDIQMSNTMNVGAWRFYEIMFSHLLEVGGTFITGCVFFAILVREPFFERNGVVAAVNFAAIFAVVYGVQHTDDTLALPMAIGYFMSLIWRLVCYIVDELIVSRLTFISRGHKALRNPRLINGLFLVGGALTITASNEGSIFLLLVLAYRHHPKAVLLTIPALVPHFLKLVAVPLFSVDALAFYDIQYHPAFYAACIYIYGLISNRQVSQVSMRMLIYGITPCLLYLLSAPLELYSGYALIVLSAARFVPYSSRKIIMGGGGGHNHSHSPAAPSPPSAPEANRRGGHTKYNLRQRRGERN
ncbi:unnamed protein product [Caenorhabditis sp. 36 PRJEB53466]|nr:unnamed protein product [Caenorhabditis sp. 36 PRJEB53466]